MEELGNVGHDGALVGDADVANVRHLEQTGDAEALLGDLERQRRVATAVLLVEVVPVNELWAVTVDECAADRMSGTGNVVATITTYNAKPSAKLRLKFWTSTSEYGVVLRWHHSKRPSRADRPSSVIPEMVNRRMSVQI